MAWGADTWGVDAWGVEAGASISAALSGTLSDGATEAEIVAGGETLVITLTGDTWEATVGADNAITTALINGLDSAQSEANGWDAVVKAGLTHTAVARTSDTIVTITLPAFGSYDITATETITVTVPASALVTSVDPAEATPTFEVTAAAAAAFNPASVRSTITIQNGVMV